MQYRVIPYSNTSLTLTLFKKGRCQWTYIYFTHKTYLTYYISKSNVKQNTWFVKQLQIYLLLNTQLLEPIDYIFALEVVVNFMGDLEELRSQSHRTTAIY